MARLTQFSTPLQRGLQSLIKGLVMSYPALITRLQELNNETSLSVKRKHDGTPGGGNKTDSTCRIATDRATMIPVLQKQITAIDLARATTAEEYREPVWDYTVKGVSAQTITHKYAISEGTLQREKNWFYKKIAYLMGYWEPTSKLERQILEKELERGRFR